MRTGFGGSADQITDQSLREDMKKGEKAGLMPRGHLLSEEGQGLLGSLRDELLLIAAFVFRGMLEKSIAGTSAMLFVGWVTPDLIRG